MNAAKKIIHIVAVLTIVGIFSGTTLAFIYKYAAPLIAKNQEKEVKEAVFNVFPDGSSYEVIWNKGDKIFLVKDKSGKELGYAFQAEGNGYQGEIKLMAGLKKDLVTLTGIEILESQETPGLGQEITSNKFRQQFVNLKDLSKAQAITGATISSKAVVAILEEKLDKIKASLRTNEASEAISN